MINIYQARVLRSSINPLISGLCVATFALGACLIIWHAAYSDNPVADVLAATVYNETQF